MGIGRSPAAKARAGLPRANPNDVRVKGFENHAERMSTLFRPDSSGSDPTRRGSLDLAAGGDDDDDDDDLDFIRHAKEAARRLRELNARNAAARPPTPASRWTAARAKISATARIAGLFQGMEPGSLRPPSGGNKVHPASTPSSVRVVAPTAVAGGGASTAAADAGMVTPRARSEHGSEPASQWGSVPNTPVTVLHQDAHSVPSSSAPSLAPSVVTDPDPGDAPRAHPAHSAPAWNARPASPQPAPPTMVEVDATGRWFVSYDDYHVSMQMAALALRAKNIALDAAMKSGAAEIEQLRREAAAGARGGGGGGGGGGGARKLTGWFSPSRKRNSATKEDENAAENEDDPTGNEHGTEEGAGEGSGSSSSGPAAAAAAKTKAEASKKTIEAVAEEPSLEEEEQDDEDEAAAAASAEEAAAIDAVADAAVAAAAAESSAAESKRQLERALAAERASTEAERAAWSMERSQLLKERDELRALASNPALDVSATFSDAAAVDASMSWDGDAESLAIEALVALATALRGEDVGFDKRRQEMRATAVAKAGGVAAVLGAMASFPGSRAVQAAGADALARMAGASERAREVLVAEADEVLGGGGVAALARAVDEFGCGEEGGHGDVRVAESAGNALLAIAASGRTEHGGMENVGRSALRRAVEAHPGASWDPMRLGRLHAWIFASCTQPQVHSSDDEDAPY